MYIHRFTPRNFPSRLYHSKLINCWTFPPRAKELDAKLTEGSTCEEAASISLRDGLISGTYYHSRLRICLKTRKTTTVGFPTETTRRDPLLNPSDDIRKRELGPLSLAHILPPPLPLSCRCFLLLSLSFSLAPFLTGSLNIQDLRGVAARTVAFVSPFPLPASRAHTHRDESIGRVRRPIRARDPLVTDP